MAYMLWNVNVDRKNKKLNRYAYNALRRRFLWNTWLRIKAFTNKTSFFPRFPWMARIQFSKKIHLC